MQQPTIRIHDNLRFTRSGIVWADYLISGLNYGYRPKEDKDIVRSAHKMLLRALPGESLLMGLCVSLDPGAVVDRMIKDIDLESHPEWAAECDATWDTLEEIRPGQRVYWLSIPLANKSTKDRLAAANSAALTTISDWIGAPRGELDPAELRRRHDQAARAISDVPHFFKPKPATAAQMVWLHSHCATRGLALDADVPPAETEVMTRAQSALMPLRIDEGAQTDPDRMPTKSTERREKKWTNALSAATARVPALDKVVKIDQPWQVEEGTASYQTFLGLANTPSGDTTFPGSEVLTLADDLAGVDVDWAIRLTIRGRQQVLQRNHRALVNLNDQYLQRESELSSGVSALDRAAAAMADYSTELESNQQEVEVEASVLLAVGAPTRQQAMDDAAQLAKLFEASAYELQSPLGYQEDMFWAMYPGAPTTKIVREFAQITTSHHFSAWVPCTQASLGDPSGPLLALNITTNRIGVVHHNTAGASGRDVAGSVGVVGELGSGKSVTLKSLAGAEVDRGAQLVCVDRTDVGEYESWATSVADAVVVDMTDPEYSVDPLRMFEPVKGSDMALAVLYPLLHVQPDEPMGVLLSEVLDPSYRSQHQLDGLSDVYKHLGDEHPDPNARELGKKMGVYAKRSFAAALFSPDLPPLDAASPAIVFRTHKLKLPRQQELEKQHLFEQLTLEKRVGRAMYGLIADLARAICFADPTRLGIFLCDECHHITRNEEGADIVIDIIRDGRKHNAAAYLGSHDPEEDFGSETLRGLIPIRIVMRQRDETLARRSLKWLGVDHNDQVLIKELTEETAPVAGDNLFVDPDRRGEGYMRDTARSIGRIKVLLPSEPSRHRAVTSTPQRRPQPGSAEAAFDKDPVLQ